MACRVTKVMAVPHPTRTSPAFRCPFPSFLFNFKGKGHPAHSNEGPTDALLPKIPRHSIIPRKAAATQVDDIPQEMVERHGTEGKPAQGIKEGITHEHLPYPLWESRGQHGVWIPMILPSKGSVLPLTKCSLLFRT